MRVFILYPAHRFSTFDVARGLEHAFQDMGHDVDSYDLHNRACWYMHLLQVEERIPEENRHIGALSLASHESIARICKHSPDLVVVVHGAQVHHGAWTALQHLRKGGTQIHLIHTESPYEDADFQHLREKVDVFWSNDWMGAKQLGVKYLPAAWDERIHRPPQSLYDPGKDPGVLFLGTCWKERAELFMQVDWTGLKPLFLGPELAWQYIQETPLEPFYEPRSVDATEHPELYGQAGACLNFHRLSVSFEDAKPVTGAWSINPRCYQVPACGGLLISDGRPEFRRIFGDALPTFDGPENLERLLRHFLENPAAREDAIFRSMEAIEKHTYRARAARILEELK